MTVIADGGRIVGWAVSAVIVFLLIGVVAVITAIRQRRIRGYAQAHDMTVRDRDSADLADRPWGCPWGPDGSRRVEEVLSGTVAGYRVESFALTWRRPRPDKLDDKGNPKTATSYYGAMALDLGAAGSPRREPLLHVRRRTEQLELLESLRPVVTGDAAFDDSFEVGAADPDLVRQAMTADLRTLLMTSHGPGFRIVDGHVVQLYDTHVPVHKLDERFGRLVGIVDLLPSAVLAPRPPA